MLCTCSVIFDDPMKRVILELDPREQRRRHSVTRFVASAAVRGEIGENAQVYDQRELADT